MAALDLHRLKIPGQRRQRLQEGDGVLGVQHTEDDMQRALIPLAAEELRQRLAGGFVMAAIEPELPAGRQALGQGAAGQALQTRRPFNLADAARLSMLVDAESLQEGEAG